MVEPIILVHGGAGAVVSGDALDAPRRAGLLAAVAAARAALAQGAVAAAAAAVAALEDDPHFNAGIGSVLASDGTVSCSASLMDGRDGRAGAVAELRRVRHPVALARSLLDHQHVFLAGAGAEAHARACGLEAIDPEDLVLPLRRTQLAQVADGRPVLDHDPGDAMGTVGAVVRDAHGALAAATSTGGLTGQLPGRIGDSPVIGAGTWADGRIALSATGTGEAFLRCAFARRVADLVELSELAPATACARALEEVVRFAGRGGCIALHADGRWCMPCTTPGMLRAMARGEEEPRTGIDREDGLTDSES